MDLHPGGLKLVIPLNMSDNIKDRFSASKQPGSNEKQHEKSLTYFFQPRILTTYTPQGNQRRGGFCFALFAFE